MFAFLNTAKKKVEGAAKTVTKDAKKGLQFLSNASDSVAKTKNKVDKTVGDLAIDTAKRVLVDTPQAGYDIVRGAAASATGNEKALENAHKAKQTDFPRVLSPITRPLAQVVETVAHPTSTHTVTPKSTSDKEIFGTEPIQNVQAGVKTNYKDHPELPAPLRAALALGYGTGQVAQDAAAVTGAKIGGTKLASETTKAAKQAVKTADEHATSVASKHPAVQALDDHLQALTQHREQLLKNDASPVAIKANDVAYTSALKARDNAIKAIKEGGFVGPSKDLPGTDSGYTSQQLDDMEAAGGAIAANTSTVEKMKTAVTATPKPGYTPPKTSAEVANESLPGNARLDPAVVDLLGQTGKASSKASKAPVLEGARDPQSVLARHFGREGSDIAYDASRAAKKRSDLQESSNALIDDAEKKLKKAAKTAVGRNDVEKRVNQALEDRANADSYLNTPEEKAVYEATKKFYDHYQGHIKTAGKATRENYSPRVARQDAEAASQGLDIAINQAFSKKTDAAFLKERTKEEPNPDLLEKPISVMRNYSSAVSKQLAYEDLMKKLPTRLESVKPIYTADQTTKQAGRKYLQKYLQDLLQPDIPTSGTGFGKVISEKTQNKLIQRTYSAALTLSPKFGIMNRTQGFATRSQVSGEARKLARTMDKKDLQALRTELTTGDNPISGEAGTNASSVGGSKTKMERVQAKVSGERANVSHAFDAGVAQHIVDSPIYKQAIKDGKKPKEAAKIALADPATKELAVRAGNVVTNTTQFGGNIANKPGWLRESGTVLGLSKKWFQQYQRFPLGMTQLLGNVTNPKMARALDIMRRGDPKQTQLVDYLKAAKTLQAALPDAKKAIKAGDSKVTHEQITKSKELLDKSIKVLDKEIKKNSQIRGTKTAKNVGKMWAAASVIQYLYTDITGSAAQKSASGTKKVTQAVRYGAPVNIPTRDQNPLNPVPSSSPITAHGISTKKILNFVPVVGPVVNRGREAISFINALTGGN